MIITATVATAAERLVVTKMLDMDSSDSSPVAETVEHPLKPNQQNHRMNTPRAPRVRLWPRIAFGFPSSAAYHVYGGGACKVVEAKLAEPAAAPDPVPGDGIDNGADGKAV